MCIRIKLVRSKVRLSGNARIASVHGPPYLFQRLVWPITVWVFLVSGTNLDVTEYLQVSFVNVHGLCGFPFRQIGLFNNGRMCYSIRYEPTTNKFIIT